MNIDNESKSTELTDLLNSCICNDERIAKIYREMLIDIAFRCLLMGKTDESTWAIINTKKMSIQNFEKQLHEAFNEAYETILFFMNCRKKPKGSYQRKFIDEVFEDREELYSAEDSVNHNEILKMYFKHLFVEPLVQKEGGKNDE